MPKKTETRIIAAPLVEAYVHGAGVLDDFRLPTDFVERIAAVNGRAKNFTTTAREVFNIALDAEEQLDSSGLPTRARVGVTVRHRGAGPVAVSYKYPVKGTAVTLLRRSSGWYLVEATEASVSPRQKASLKIDLTAVQREIVSKVALRPYTVVAPPMQADAVNGTH